MSVFWLFVKIIEHNLNILRGKHMFVKVCSTITDNCEELKLKSRADI